MTTLLFQAVRDTLGTLLADPTHLGAQPGIIAALHTWSQTLVLHPHVHCLVTGGGLTPLARGGLSAMAFCCPCGWSWPSFGGKCWQRSARRGCGGSGATGAATAAAVAQPPEPPRSPNEDEVERADHGALSPRAGVVTYLARYLRGGPIKNARLVAYDGARVTFTYRARQRPRRGLSHPSG